MASDEWHDKADHGKRFDAVIRGCLGMPPKDQSEATIRKEVADNIDAQAKKYWKGGKHK